MIGHTADGALTNFGIVGNCAVVMTLACMWLVRALRPVVEAVDATKVATVAIR